MDEISELKILQLKNSNDLENPYPNASGYVLRAGRPETGTFEISTDCGVAQLAAREAHNLKVVGSNPAPAIPDEMSPTKGGGNADHLHSAADVEEIAWLIVWAVESDCGRNLARGDNGKAAGHAQFRRPRWDSVCRRMGAAWQWPQDCCDYEKARSVTIGAWRLERPEAISAGDVETLVRSHRLPADPGRKSNDEYWRKACAKAQLYASNHLFPCAAEARQDFQPGPADLSESDTATDGQTQGKPRPAIKEAWAAVATYLKRFQSESEADCGRGNDAIVETYKGRAPPCRTQNQAAGNRQQGAENNEDSIQRR